MDSVTDYLRGKNVEVYPTYGDEVTAHCWWCSDSNPKGKGKLYINSETWLFDCKRCGERGGRRKMLEFYGDVDDSVYEPGTDPARRRAVLEEYCAHAEELLLANEGRLSYLFRRGLSPETIIEARLGFAPRNYGMTDSLPSARRAGGFTVADLVASGMRTVNGREFLQGKITIPYVTNGAVVSIRGKDPDGKYVTASGDNVRLYGSDELREADEVLITEGEFDALVVRQHLSESGSERARNIAVVAIPGAGALPGGTGGFEGYFTKAKRIYLGLDPDEVGKREAIKIKALLGAKCRIVKLPQGEDTDTFGAVVKCDWTEYLRARTPDHPCGGHGWSEVMGLIADADAEGRRVYSMADAGRRWARDENERPGIKFGFPTLDAILKPGLKPGNVAIPLAKTGTGKTVFLANVAYYTRDVPTLFITLEATSSEVYNILRRITHFHHSRFDDSQVQAVYPKLGIVDENRLQRADFSLLVAEYADEHGFPPELIFVDYLGYYARGMPGGSPYEKTSNGIMQLKEEAKAHKVAIIAPHQVNRGAKDGKPFDADEARDSGVVEETGDFVFGLFKPGDAVDTARATGMISDALGLSILKSRRGGKGRVVNLSMSAASLAIVDTTNRRDVSRIQIENTAINRGEHYDDIYRRQRVQANEDAQLRLVR